MSEITGMFDKKMKIGYITMPRFISFYPPLFPCLTSPSYARKKNAVCTEMVTARNAAGTTSETKPDPHTRFHQQFPPTVAGCFPVSPGPYSTSASGDSVWVILRSQPETASAMSADLHAPTPPSSQQKAALQNVFPVYVVRSGPAGLYGPAPG